MIKHDQLHPAQFPFVLRAPHVRSIARPLKMG
jgi:hypothetical protein